MVIVDTISSLHAKKYEQSLYLQETGSYIVLGIL